MKKILFITALLTIGFSSCEKDNIETFNSEYDSIRFASYAVTPLEPGGGQYSNEDHCWRLDYSFLEDPMAESVNCKLITTLVGMPTDKDRKIACIIDKERSTAPDGTYDIVESVLPANSLQGYILVNVKNTEELQENTYELYIKLVPSEELMTGPKEYLTAKLSWHNQIEAPRNNNHIKTYNMLIQSPLSFVTTSTAYYSPHALKAIVDALGWNDWDDQTVHGVKYNNATTYFGYKYLPRSTFIYADNSYKGYAAKLRDYLKKYEEEHGAPLLHDAGTYKGQPVEARTY